MIVTTAGAPGPTSPVRGLLGCATGAGNEERAAEDEDEHSGDDRGGEERGGHHEGEQCADDRGLNREEQQQYRVAADP